MNIDAIPEIDSNISFSFASDGETKVYSRNPFRSVRISVAYEKEDSVIDTIPTFNWRLIGYADFLSFLKYLQS